MVTWDGGRVSTVDSVQVAATLGGRTLHDSYVEAVRTLTFGLARLRGDTVRIGPIELLRFGPPRIDQDSVEWPIEGGLLARGAGGRWRIESSGGRITASVAGYRPSLARPLYAVTQLQVHLLFTRLYLLRLLAAAKPALGRVARREDRLRAAAVDVALCLTLARLSGRRRPRRALLIAATYHVACWSLFGRTLGGLVLRERVIALDGEPPTPTQAMLRLVLIPASWLARRPLHDEIAATTVIED